MLSEGVSDCERKRCRNVLILVVMEYALGDGGGNRNVTIVCVLILVVMEYALGDFAALETEFNTMMS